MLVWSGNVVLESNLAPVSPPPLPPSLQQLHLLIYQLNLGPLRGADVLFVIQN